MPAPPRITRELNLLSEKLPLLNSDPKRSRKNLRRELQRSILNVWESEDGPRD
jgi:Ca-activated chloride channel family protein